MRRTTPTSSLEIDDELLGGSLLTVASGMARHRDAAAIRIHNRHAALYAARLRPGRQVTLPEAPFLRVFVARGSVDLEVASSSRATRPVSPQPVDRGVAAVEPAEILIWEMRATVTVR